MRDAPECYVNLMKKCWDSNPSNRPTITELEYKISEWIRCISEYYIYNKDGNYKVAVPDVDIELTNDMLEFAKANNQEENKQEKPNIFVMQSYLQANYTSRRFTKITEILAEEDSKCLDEFMV
ncbi:unnamed protein product [Rhizophagus irregularis]|uniref:Serine-threonine/tyrosine-protein kinase catalytic domain-containing protein n=1 Tax=Rhizophagus irregularis TaxID=588596 RepID=A0A916EA92_9GLOM|nr:unnamed protein product [Rhizophagus irregularis]CAB4493740.1 unnamed protein product [Rhizophagus irregularis]CAB5371603.1 unnamed protein product [Rhizophagus irregularis]CAB5383670.1 unnamed protein product [Rhizophagus irregularis]